MIDSEGVSAFSATEVELSAAYVAWLSPTLGSLSQTPPFFLGEFSI
jgi:hypothetical protein